MNRFRGADFDTLRIPTAKIAMVSLLTQNVKGSERTPFGPDFDRIIGKINKSDFSLQDHLVLAPHPIPLPEGERDGVRKL